MLGIKRNSREARFFKNILIIGLVFAIAVLGLHIWFVNNARAVLKQIVSEKSKGQINLELSRLSFDFIDNRLQIREANLSTLANSDKPLSYQVKFKQLTLRIASFWPLLLQKKLVLDSIKLQNPEIEVTQWRRDTLSKKNDIELSVPQQMGRLYNSMLDVLETFGIRRISINNAKLSLINKMDPDAVPVSISNIYFDLIRTAENTAKRDQFVKGEQTIDLITTSQNIALPGGRHRLSFKNFSLQLFRKRIEMDSCTITAQATDTTKSRYTIFFKKLSLVGVDFDAMYRRNLIRADSVYCENPTIDIDINTNVTNSKKGEKLDPQKLIQDLTGDLDLAFVGVKDAGIHIDIEGKNTRSLFNSNKDDFEMRGLRINTDSSSPVVVQRFDMLVRDYQLYNEDSSTAYKFDSIHFANNKIVLNNFSVATASSSKEIHNRRDFRVPYFELTGLDWYQLIFEQNVKVTEASLYYPTIKYQKNKAATRGKKLDIFSSLQSLDSLLTLDRLNIVNGQISASLGKATSLNMENANLTLYSNRVLESSDQQDLRTAIEKLSFSKGVIRHKDISIQLQNARYTGPNLLYAEKLLVTSLSNNLKADVQNVYLDNVLLDNDKESIIIDGVRWSNANIITESIPEKNEKKNNGNFSIKNIQGNNSSLKFSGNDLSAATFITSLSIASLLKEEGQPLSITGVSAAGKDLAISNSSVNIKTASYNVASNKPSHIYNFHAQRIQGNDTMRIEAPQIDFQTSLDDLLAGDMRIENAQLQRPTIRLIKRDTAASTKQNSTTIQLSDLEITEPDIHVAIYKNDSVTLVNLPRTDRSVINLTGFKMDGSGITAGSLKIKTDAATLVKRTGETFGVEQGKLDLDLSDIAISKKDGKPFWSAAVKSLYLENPNAVTIGKNKNKLQVEKASLGNLKLSSEHLSNVNQLIKFNISAWLRTTNGQYIDSTTTLKWYNAEYNYKNRTLSLDSFLYHPTQERDSVLARSTYQTDYITFRSGPVKLTGFNLEKYELDSALLATAINVERPHITVYRDKLPPFLSGVIKPLPVDIIKSIRLPVLVNKVNITDGTLQYTEKNAKSRAEGDLLLTRINGSLSNIKNRDLKEKDSLFLSLTANLMDSALLNLRVKESYTDSLSGFLMTLRMRPTTLTFLNPVLTPLSNIVITSGAVDSFQLRAIGHEHLSLGELNMHYRNLKIKLVKDGQEYKTNFLTRSVSFLANSLLIKKNNNGRRGLVYFERLRDRSFFNYIVKMTFSGMATSIGVKKNRKYIKQYNRELKERNLPPIDFE